MRKLIIAAGAVVALAGCTSINIESIDAAIRKQLPLACAGLDVAHAAFAVANQARQFSETVQRAELTAYTDARFLCDNPSQVTAISVVTSIFAVAVKINGYVSQAEAAGVE